MTSKEALSSIKPDRDSFINEVISPTGVSGAVIAAFEEVDRAEFVPRALRDTAYTDQIIRVSEGSTISQPSFVARMINLLELAGHEKILEIGTATGYQAALLSRLAGEVDTIETDPRLVYWANSNLKRLHYPNVTVHHGDGAKGIESRAPFDGIIVTAGLRDIPQALLNQLAVGGRLVAPVGEIPEDGRLVVLTKTSSSETSHEDHGWCGFVPLYSQEQGGWTKEALEEVREIKKRERQEIDVKEREELKAALMEAGGEESYRDTIRATGSSVARIVEKKSLTEDQVLDLICFFSAIFRPDRKVPKTDTPEKPVEEPVADIDKSQ
ncbi:MAG: protein-L-isoaspartate(D-aspartate) O-methyltransferase [Patescibacteria group bacterium]